MDKKCQSIGCDKYFRQIVRVGEDLIYLCNEHHTEFIKKRNEISSRVASMTDIEKEERLEELIDEEKKEQILQ